VVSFPAPARVLSWALVNGGFCHGDHIVNHWVHCDDTWFSAQPRQWLKRAAMNLGLQGTVVAMATAVEMKDLVRVSFSRSSTEVTCFATVGCGNALSVGDRTSVAMMESTPVLPHTINMILIVRPALTHEALVEAIQIATEGRVRALYEARVQSSVSSLAASGTGTDCIAIASLGGEAGAPYCGKHTEFGELIGRAAYEAVKNGLERISR
jgi:adenosylcobinamide amidohydrolase